jgi:aminoglycoside phosphotransferase (APT) family kinase protein
MDAMQALAAALAGVPGLAGIGPADLKKLPDKGIAHDHLRIGTTGLLARVPRLAQFATNGDAYIRYQEASYRRARASGRVPGLIAAIAPGPGLPLGALVIEEIKGGPPRVPRDMPAIADALARLHSLPVPPPGERPPLLDHADPALGTLQVIERNAVFLEAAGASPATGRAVEEEIAWARRFAAEAKGKDQPVTLVASDTHPGNFLIDARGAAMLVDVEKMIYGSPAIDLAHATLRVSATWDMDCGAILAAADVRGFYRAYLGKIDAALARGLKPWLAPMRRLTWLRTTTWAARFKAETVDAGKFSGLEPGFVAHVLGRIAAILDPATVAACRAEWLDGSGGFQP